MTVIDQVESPRARRRRSWAFDVLIALVVGAQAVGTAFNPHVPLVLGIVTGTLSGILVVFRRMAPVPVFLGTWTLALIGGLADVQLGAHLAVVVALFTVAATRARRDALLATAMTEAGVLVGSVIVAGGHWWVSAIFLTGMVAAAVGLGLYVNTRRSYIAELHDRAARLERERDQQGALAVAAERARIAREMHDVLAHNLAVMVALSDGAVAASTASPDRAAEAMRAVSATGRQALSDTRRLLGVLRDGGSAGAGRNGGPEERQPVPDLGQLETLIGRVRAAGLPVTYEVTGAAPNLPAGVQLTVFRLVQEALTNTLKHAGQPARASVRLGYAEDEVWVDIEDDGAGIAAPVPSTPGAGLIGMRERVQSFGGDLQTGPRPTGGWRVSARLKVEDPA